MLVAIIQYATKGKIPEVKGFRYLLGQMYYCCNTDEDNKEIAAEKEVHPSVEMAKTGRIHI